MSRAQEWLRWLVATTFWRAVFWWKRRTGWLDLGQVIGVAGIVRQLDANVGGPLDDGDVSFDVELDPLYTRYITGFGGRLTGAADSPPKTLHCEVTPWSPNPLRQLAMGLKPGQRVRVTGRWGFDGVHTGRPMWQEVLLALVRHQPNVRDGWFEIHPVQKIETLD